MLPSVSYETLAHHIYRVPAFLSADECDRLVQLAERQGLDASRVDSDQSETIRTSSSYFVKRADNIHAWFHARVAALLPGTSPAAYERLQITKYTAGQYYGLHLDALESEPDNPRIATVLVYLNDITAGGCTVFPIHNLRVTPTMGTALVFFPCSADGVADAALAHAAEPPLSDVKYVAQLWIRARPLVVWPIGRRSQAAVRYTQASV